MSGVLLTFEGTEGTGKSTQAGLLADALRARGRDVLSTREPGGTDFGRRLRGILLDPRESGLDPCAELFCYLADRAQHARTVLAPALEAGTWVLCDRFADATLAYQGYGRGLDRGLIAAANAAATGGLVPDLTILLELDHVREGIERARRRQAADGTAGVEDRIELEDERFHQRVREGYRALAAGEPGRWIVLDASAPAERIHGAILGAVLARLGHGRAGT